MENEPRSNELPLVQRDGVLWIARTVLIHAGELLLLM